MDIASVCILGGSGFVGRALAARLSSRGVKVRVLTRCRPRAMPVTMLPLAEVVVGDPHRPEDLASALRGMDAAVNLVGILHESGHQTFRACHVELPRRLAESCRAAGVGRLLHMSALGAAADAPSRYQRSKAEGEAAIRATSGPVACTIFRPSVIFGRGDRFLNLFADLARTFPVIPLAGARTRFQPIWVEDVARCFADALADPRTAGRTLELGGPGVRTLEELVRFAAQVVGRRPIVFPLPGPLAFLQALALEWLPGHLMTRDNLRSMQVDNVCPGPFPDLFGFQPSALEAIVPSYLGDEGARARYSRYRHFAGR